MGRECRTSRIKKCGASAHVHLLSASCERFSIELRRVVCVIGEMLVKIWQQRGDEGEAGAPTCSERTGADIEYSFEITKKTRAATVISLRAVACMQGSGERALLEANISGLRCKERKGDVFLAGWGQGLRSGGGSVVSL